MSDDPYYYPGTDVLINLLNLRDKAQLERFETGSAQLQTDQAKFLKGPFDLNRLKSTHQLLFGRVYPWSGQLRENTGKMTKDRPAGYTVAYGPSAFVGTQIALVFADLGKENYLKDLPPEQFAKRLAYFYGELDSIHSFREGNSRTLRLFTTYLAQDAGHTLDWSRSLDTDDDRNKLFHARDLALMRADSSELSSIVLSCLAPPEQICTEPLKTQEKTMAVLTSQQEIAPLPLSTQDHVASSTIPQNAMTPEKGSATLDEHVDRTLDRPHTGIELGAKRTEPQSIEARTVGQNDAGAADKDFQASNAPSKEPIAVRLTEEQAKLLISAEYPNNMQQQMTAMYNIFSGKEPVDVLNESVALDYSEDRKTFFATLDRDEKPVLDAKLTQLQAENQRVTVVSARKSDPLQRQRQRGMERS